MVGGEVLKPCQGGRWWAQVAGGVALTAAVALPAFASPQAAGSPFPRLPDPPAPPDQLVVVKEAAPPRGRSTYLALLTREADRRGLPPAVADAVAQVESSYNPSAIGKVGELGLMQVRPTTAAMLGHRGPSTELLKPETNIRYGVAYLAKAWELSQGDLCRALMKYRAGHGEERMTPLSVDYCRRARAHLAAIGSPHAGTRQPSHQQDSRPTNSADRSALTTGSVAAVATPRPDPVQARHTAEIHRLWAEHVARVRNIEKGIDRVMGASRSSPRS